MNGFWLSRHCVSSIERGMEREKRYFWRKEVDEERIDPSSADQTEDILCNGNKIEDFYYNDSRVRECI